MLTHSKLYKVCEYQSACKDLNGIKLLALDVLFYAIIGANHIIRVAEDSLWL